MHTKIIYTLVCDESDFYWEQALISVYSLRMHNPDAIVEMVMDMDTAKSLIDKRAKIKDYITSVIEVDVPEEYDKKCRSRYLKTNLRQLVKGDYLFIDCDTIICGKLDDIDNIKGEISAVADVNDPLPLNNKDAITRCESIGFHGLKGKPYYNSGVMLVRDTPMTHQFYNKWFNNWKHSFANGVSFDQPALCQTNTEMSEPIKELPGIWNCQFKYQAGYALLHNALIMHYFNGIGKQWIYPTEQLFLSVKRKGYVDSTIKRLLKHPYSQLYTVMTINKESAYNYFNSPMIDVYYNNPPLFRFLAKLARPLSPFFKMTSNIKRKVRS